ncbi:MAG TPA: 3-oxoacyl-ACP reductase family protein [Myxococcota bacterium]
MSEARVALVTGAGTGIGAACALALAAAGFRVGIHYRSSEQKARAVVDKCGGDAFLLRADLAQPAQIDALIGALKERAGRLDVLVNNAGFNVNAPMVTMKLEDYDAVAAIERGTWYLTKLALRRFLLRSDDARIINITSVVGHTGNPGQAPYTMAKAGLDALTKSLAQELSGRNIRVNSVAPGFIDTEMTSELPGEVKQSILGRIPLGRMGSADEVAEVVAWLATKASYVHGTVLHVNGGMYGG